MRDGEPYIEYELLDSNGVLIPLSEAVSITVNGDPFDINGSDALWFLKTSATKNYVFLVKLNNNITYQATLNHIDSSAYTDVATTDYSTVID